MTNVLTSVLAVFSAIVSWIAETMGDLVPIFWDAAANDGTGGLTFFGVLAVGGLAISVCLLILNIVQGFLHFRG